MGRVCLPVSRSNTCPHHPCVSLCNSPSRSGDCQSAVQCDAALTTCSALPQPSPVFRAVPYQQQLYEQELCLSGTKAWQATTHPCQYAEVCKARWPGDMPLYSGPESIPAWAVREGRHSTPRTVGSASKGISSLCALGALLRRFSHLGTCSWAGGCGENWKER